MIKRVFVFILLLGFAGRAAATPFGDFQNQATAATLKPFAMDLGGALGGAAFHSGRALGFPGFDAGVVGTMQTRPDRDDLILRNSGVQRFGVPLIQVEAGLPHNVDIIAHGISYAGARVFGGGIRYGIHKSGILSVVPDVAVSAFYDRVNQTFFNATHYSVNAVSSFHLPIVHPYLGVGEDITSIRAGAATTAGVTGMSATAHGSRLTAGLDISPLPFIHAYCAYTLLHGISGLDAGVGARF